MLRNILLAFIPVFVAVDAIGVLPIFATLTGGLSEKQKARIIYRSMLTAIALAAGFVLVGKLVFKWLSIEVGDFMVAGGAILFCIAILDIVTPEKKRRIPEEDFGVVPLGTPLIVGPAVLTTSMVVISEYGEAATLVSVVANILFAGLCFRFSFVLMRLVGKGGSRALSKIASLLLAAIAVMLIRKGIVSLLGGTTMPH